VDNSYSEDLHERTVAEQDRTRPPESYPALPDIPLARYTDPDFYQAEIDAPRRYRGGDSGRQAERSRLTTLVGVLHVVDRHRIGPRRGYHYSRTVLRRGTAPSRSGRHSPSSAPGSRSSPGTSSRRSTKTAPRVLRQPHYPAHWTELMLELLWHGDRLCEAPEQLRSRMERHLARGAVKHFGGQPPNNSQCSVPTTQPMSTEGPVQ
jgi:hypothetical protein